MTLVMPTVDVLLDLSIDHREREQSARVSIPFPRERDDGPSERLVVGK